MRNKKMNMYGVNINDLNNNSNIMINEFSQLELYVTDPNLNSNNYDVDEFWR